MAIVIPDRPDPDEVITSQWGDWVHDSTVHGWARDVPFSLEGLPATDTILGQNVNLGAPPFDYSVLVTLTWNWYAAAGGSELVIRTGDVGGSPVGTEFGPFPPPVVNKLVMGAAQTSWAKNAGQTASVKVSGFFSVLSAGAVRGGIARVQLVPR